MYKYLYILLISVSYISNSQPLEVIYYYDNGYISSKGYIENNKPNGYWFNYYDSGIIKSKGNRINFLLEGEWFFYDEKGHKKSIINYEEGIKKGEEYGNLIINIDGKPSLSIPLLASENVGKVNPFYKIFSVIEYLIFGTSLNEAP